MRTDADLNWLAGVFEGEGSIRINSVTKRNWGSLLADMVNTDYEMVERFHERWGGFYRRVEASGNRQGYWRWRIASKNAAAFLREMYPYFRTDRMRTKARLGIAFQEQKIKGRWSRSDSYHLAQIGFYQQMRQLNVRGAEAAAASERKNTAEAAAKEMQS